MDYAKPSPTYAKSVDQFLAQVRSPVFSPPVSESERDRPAFTHQRGNLCVRAWAGAPASRCGVMRIDLTAAHVARAPDARWQQTAAHGLEALACDTTTIRSCLTAWTSANVALHGRELELPDASASKLTGMKPGLLPLGRCPCDGPLRSRVRPGCGTGFARSEPLATNRPPPERYRQKSLLIFLYCDCLSAQCRGSCSLRLPMDMPSKVANPTHLPRSRGLSLSKGPVRPTLSETARCIFPAFDSTMN